MKRRLDVAMGLVHRPHVLFLDEPTTGLDPEARAAMWEELERLAAAERLTILLTTHYLEEADRLARRVAIVSRGQVVVEGTPEELKRELRGDAVTVELDGADTDRAAELARGLDGVHEVTPDGRRLHLRVDHGAQAVPVILGALDAAGAGVHAVTVSRPSLDDVYLHHTGRDFRADDEGARVNVVSQTLFLCGRVLRNLSRQPIWIVVMIVQPMFWLLLYSQLFRRITELPGFGTTSYIDYLTPGVAVMTAFFSGSWAGMGMIEDLDRGVLERFLATPASRGAIVFGRILESAIVATLQALLILLTGLLLGATNGGVVGWLVILLAAFLTAAGFAGLSHGIALRTRQEASMIAVAQFIGAAAALLLLAPDRARADPGLDAGPLAPEPGRVGGAGRARRGAPRHRLGRDGHVPAPPRRLRRPDDGVRDAELPRLPADALSARRQAGPRPAPGSKRLRGGTNEDLVHVDVRRLRQGEQDRAGDVVGHERRLERHLARRTACRPCRARSP